MDGVAPSHPTAEIGGSSAGPRVLAFAADGPTESALREGLGGTLAEGIEIRRAPARSALTQLMRMPSPRLLIIDVSGDGQPLALLSDLRQVVEPDVTVMIIGDRQDLTFYREVTRTLGVAEYLYKPVAAEMIARHFGQFLHSGSAIGGWESGGRLLGIRGARSGVGVSTIAANLAWYLANVGRRHALLLDADLFTGTAPLLLGCKPGQGLRRAIETPERVDALFVERLTFPVADRLHLLATQEPLQDRLGLQAGPPENLIHNLRRRFNYVVVDHPFAPDPFVEAIADQCSSRVLVLQPTLACLRDALRLLALPAAPGLIRRPLLVLNRADMPGGLDRTELESALGHKIDVAIPDLPRLVSVSQSDGTPAASKRGPFRNAIAALAREAASVAPEVTRTSRRWWKA